MGKLDGENGLYQLVTSHSGLTELADPFKKDDALQCLKDAAGRMESNTDADAIISVHTEVMDRLNDLYKGSGRDLERMKFCLNKMLSARAKQLRE